MSERGFDLERFEAQVAKREHEKAAVELTRLVDELNAYDGALSHAVQDAASIARIAAALSALFSDPMLQFTREGYQRLALSHRWLAATFGASVFGTSDHAIRALSMHPAGSDDGIVISERDLYKFCLLYSLDSSIPLDAEVLWRKDKGVAATLFLSLLSSRIVLSPAAHEKRERLLEWLPARLGEIALQEINPGCLHEVCMQSSYAVTPRKHEIKKAVNRMIRRWLEESGLTKLETRKGRPRSGRPTIVVVFERYHSRHAVYRVFSKALEALRERFRVVALSLYSELGPDVTGPFDAVIPARFPPEPVVRDELERIAGLVGAHQPDIVFYVGVGMSYFGMFLANLRLAPLQVASHGHPSSTFSDAIDYFCLEDFYADVAPLFSERLLFLPGDGMVQVPPNLAPLPARSGDGTINAAVVLSPMKLNPVFLRACAEFLRRSRVPMRVHFLVGATGGIAFTYIEKQVRALVPDARVYPQLGSEGYARAISGCDLYLEPFPFGNANSTIDCLALGVPGVCLRGPEIFGQMGSHILRRAGMDSRLITHSIEEYIATACELARDEGWRSALRAYLRHAFDPVRVRELELFRGEPGRLADALLALCRERDGQAAAEQ